MIDSGDGQSVHPELKLTRAEVIWACQNEMARTVEDVLSRRSRSLLFDARAASEAAEKVAGIMSSELERDELWAADQVSTFQSLAERYTV